MRRIMNEENIFKLLLIILLLGNNYDRRGECASQSLYGSINDVIILALLLGLTNDSVNSSPTAGETSF